MISNWNSLVGQATVASQKTKIHDFLYRPPANVGATVKVYKRKIFTILFKTKYFFNAIQPET